MLNSPQGMCRGGWGSNVNSCNGTSLPPNGIFSYAHNPPLFFTETSVIKHLQLKTLITDHVYDKKEHDWSIPYDWLSSRRKCLLMWGTQTSTSLRRWCSILSGQYMILLLLLWNPSQGVDTDGDRTVPMEIVNCLASSCKRNITRILTQILEFTLSCPADPLYLR